MGKPSALCGFAPDAPHYGELTINLLIAGSRLVDHNAPTAVADVPLGREILVPRAARDEEDRDSGARPCPALLHAAR